MGRWGLVSHFLAFVPFISPIDNDFAAFRRFVLSFCFSFFRLMLNSMCLTWLNRYFLLPNYLSISPWKEVSVSDLYCFRSVFSDWQQKWPIDTSTAWMVLVSIVSLHGGISNQFVNWRMTFTALCTVFFIFIESTVTGFVYFRLHFGQITEKYCPQCCLVVFFWPIYHAATVSIVSNYVTYPLIWKLHPAISIQYF